jgi:hypothetical protein
MMEEEMMVKLPSVTVIALTSLLFSTSGSAVTATYTDQASFLAALPGPASTLDFDSLAAGTTIADGDTVDGITFNYNFGGVQMQVTDVFATTSSPNFLGTDDADVFQDGDDFNLSFAAVNAIGMFFISADEMFDDDITLSAGGTSVGLSVADAGPDVGDGGIPYFLGIIDDTNPFTTASITTIGGGFFLYNVDDITTAVVPLPGALWLFGSGLIGLLSLRRKR